MNYEALDEALAYLNGESVSNRYVYESLQDEFNLDILLAEAEQELLESLSGIVLESESITALNEGVRETIMKYVEKIVNGIQKVWDKFINLYTNAELKRLKEKIKPVIDKSDNIDFTINNYKEYTGMNKFDALTTKPFDYDRMKDSLTSTNDYIKANYTELDMANSKNMKEAIEKYLGKRVVDKQKCDKQLLNNIYDFVATDYFKYRDSVQNDIEALNRSNETIKNMVNQIVSSETPANEASYDMYFEADTNGNNSNGDAKTSFTDNSGETTKTDGSEQTKKENENRKNITKAVTTYMSASTKVLSAKMSILNKQKRESFLILNHFYNSKKINDTAVAAKNKAGEIKTNVVSKVNTRLKK